MLGLKMPRLKVLVYFIFINACVAGSAEPARLLVLMSDFGESERFVASMKGVAAGVDPELRIHDLTHQIEPFNIWQASYVLAGAIDYWPKGTVFVCVVDPGVGTERRSVVVRTRSGHYVVTPDNGTLTLIAERQGIDGLREIDERVNRRPGSEASHTFHGRDVYAFTGARLAAGIIDFKGVGPPLDLTVLKIQYQRAQAVSDSTVIGNVTHVEKPFGNIVTNIPRSLVEGMGIFPGDQSRLMVEIAHAGNKMFAENLPYRQSFGFVQMGEPLLYVDSEQIIGLAINNGDFAEHFSIAAGADWTIRLHREITPE
jgi:hypothetical protein